MLEEIPTDTLTGVTEFRPETGSCARCRDALNLAAVKAEGVWYCSTACAEGRPLGSPRRRSVVAEACLYNRPRRFFRERRPKELRSMKPGT